MPSVGILFFWRGLLFLQLVRIGHVTMGGDLWASESL